MEHNVGKTDKIIRYILAVVFAYLGFTYNYWWFLATVILVYTAYAGFCGPYKLFGINTCKVK